jgi:hypothetical protein
VRTVPETQEAAEAGSAQDDDADLESLLQENNVSSKHNKSQDLFGVEEKVHQWPPQSDLLLHMCMQ